MMKVQFLKVDKIIESGGIQLLEIPPGGVHVTDGDKTLALSNRLVLKLNTRRFIDLTRTIKFDVYYGSEINPVRTEEHALINLLAVEGLVNIIYKTLGEIE